MRVDFNMDDARFDPTGAGAGKLEMSHTIRRATTLVMAIACGVAAANIYYNQPMLGIMEAAFPGHVTVIGLVPTATQLGFATGLLLLVPLGGRFDRRRLILIQLAALALSLAAAALAPDAWSLVVASALVGATSSVAQQIVPFAAELAEPSRRGATIGIVMSGLLCGILFGRALAGAVGDHYGWRAMFWAGADRIGAAHFLAVHGGAQYCYGLDQVSHVYLSQSLRASPYTTRPTRGPRCSPCEGDITS
jgi:predicted MFS family arabinose efflux permease